MLFLSDQVDAARKRGSASALEHFQPGVFIYASRAIRKKNPLKPLAGNKDGGAPLRRHPLVCTCPFWSLEIGVRSTPSWGCSLLTGWFCTGTCGRYQWWGTQLWPCLLKMTPNVFQFIYFLMLICLFYFGFTRYSDQYKLWLDCKGVNFGLQFILTANDLSFCNRFWRSPAGQMI